MSDVLIIEGVKFIIKFIVGLDTPSNHPVRPGPARLREYLAVLQTIGNQQALLLQGQGTLRRREQQSAEPAFAGTKKTRAVYGEDTKQTALRIRKRLAKEGWDHGPLSIWFEALDTQEFGDTQPSVATIGRILAAAGVTKTNPRKRPRKSWLRLARSHAMEMWQLDGLEYRLFDEDATKVMIYQLIDDGTRFDVGTRCLERMENGADAIATIKAAFEEYGIPQQMLSDNGGAFNLMRQGVVGDIETVLASVGCEAISGQFSHPQTQGKNERSHGTLTRFLDAHAPKSLDQLATLLAQFRDHYNYRRRHQALKVGYTYLTPGQAWEAGDHRGWTGSRLTSRPCKPRPGGTGTMHWPRKPIMCR